MKEKVSIEASIKLDHIGRLFSMIANIAAFEGQRIEAISVLPGGLTNSNYKVKVGEKNYAVRIAGDGTLEYLDRPAEKHNAGLMADMGISAPIVWYDETSGCQVCDFIEGDTLHKENFNAKLAHQLHGLGHEEHQEHENLRRAARIFSKFHNSDAKFISVFDPFKETYGYFDLLKEKNHKDYYEGFDEVSAVMDRIDAAFKKNPPKQAACHNDPLPENYILNGERMFLIDWEYAGMNDPSFDIAALIIENSLNVDEEEIFLTEYFGAKPTFKQTASVTLNKFVVDALWTIWALLQIATGKEHEYYWPYGYERFKRCVDIMNEPDFEKYIQAFE
jgi:thiamine kinase-like enzyme